MNSDTQTHAAQRAIETLLTVANGGTAPRIEVYMARDRRMTAMPAFDPEGKKDTLLAGFNDDGRLEIAVGIRTHWKTLWHSHFRPARTPGGQLILLSSSNSRMVHVAIEDDRFYFEEGSPLLTPADEHAALARFDAEFEALLGGAR